ncbi:hypothetical protein BKA60DRAFT_450919 [Fusarium oxysporum]|nr:hypothetical protein BKA60DRAFT_450919 [Fusarium oxysporum]
MPRTELLLTTIRLESGLSARVGHPQPEHFGLEKRQFRQHRARVNWIVTLAQATDLILNVFVQTDSNGGVSIVPEQVDLGWILSTRQPTGGTNEYASVLSIVRPWGRASAQVFWNAQTGSWVGVVTGSLAAKPASLWRALSSLGIRSIFAVSAAIVEWEWEGATRCLATPDPDNVSIRFTIHIDSTHDKHRAHFEIIIPVKFKDKPSSAAVLLRISPLFITCFRFSTNIDPSDSIKKQRFDSAACLEFELGNTVAVLVPSYVKEPISASRPRSGKVLDSLYELSRVTTLRIYIQDSLLSLDQLSSISDRVTKGQLEPFSGPEYDISRMFSGSGAKATKLAPPKPPSYEKATSSQPPSAPSYQRKRPRQDSPQGPESISQVWDKLQKLESLFHSKVGELTAENAKLRDQKLKPDESQAETTQPTDQSQVIIELRAENARLREEVERLKNRQEDLEAEVASLQTAQRSEKDTEEVAIIEIRDDIESLERRLSWVENGKDEYFMKQIKQEIFDELATRVLGG